MDPFIGAALVSAGASLLGGIFDRKDARESAGRQMHQMIRTGAEYGLHPSTSIGANIPGYTPAFGGALSEAGTAIQRGLSAREENRLQRENMKKQNQLIDAEILESTSRTILNNANARRTSMASGSVVDPFAMRQENALIEVRMENGEIIRIPNPDVYEIGPTELATGRVLLEGARELQRQKDGNWVIVDTGWPIPRQRPERQQVRDWKEGYDREAREYRRSLQRKIRR